MSIKLNSIEYYKNQWLGLTENQVDTQLLATAHCIQETEAVLRSGCQVDVWTVKDLYTQLQALQQLKQEKH